MIVGVVSRPEHSVGSTAGAGQVSHRKWAERNGGSEWDRLMMIKPREWPWGQAPEKGGGQNHCRTGGTEGPQLEKEREW